MVNLTPEDREALAAALPAGLGPASLRYSPLMFKNRSTAVECLTGFGEMAMDAVTPAVEAIVARHVAAALNEAADEIEATAAANVSPEVARYAYLDAARIVRAAIPPP